jgi:hypothetical protein
MKTFTFNGISRVQWLPEIISAQTIGKLFFGQGCSIGI